MWDALPPRTPADEDPAVTAAIAAFAVLRAQNEAVVERIAAGHGIGASDVRAITFIDANENATPKRVADFLGFTTGATTTLLDRLERAGQIERTPHPDDRRSIVLRLTPAGATLMAGIWSLYLAAFAQGLADADAERFTADLHAISRRLGELLETLTAS